MKKKVVSIFNLMGGGGIKEREHCEGGHDSKYFHQRGAIFRARRFEGPLLFEEIQYVGFAMNV